VFLYSLALLLISAADLRYRVIPKGLNLTLVAITTVYLMFAGKTASLSASLFASLIYALLYRLSRGGLGYGDVRLAPAAIDFQAVTPAGSLSIHLLGWTFAGVFLLIKRNSSPSLPFAPFLLPATLIINHL
jgi:prepilin signal peptidase PulO-like enzyme (type II secretory pathway)